MASHKMVFDDRPFGVMILFYARFSQAQSPPALPAPKGSSYSSADVSTTLREVWADVSGGGGDKVTLLATKTNCSHCGRGNHLRPEGQPKAKAKGLAKRK